MAYSAHTAYIHKKKDSEEGYNFIRVLLEKKPASNYSPAVKYAVPSSQGPLSIVFGMGT